MVVKPTAKKNEEDTISPLFPLVMVFLIAIVILLIISKIKQGPTTNKILNLLKRLSNGIDNKTKSGRFKNL